jgi:CheY-like chemotaxis protein
VELEFMDETRLLIVDDDAQTGAIFKKVAELEGISAMAVTSADDAKTQLREFDPQIIILDMVMPDMDGIEMVTWLGGQGFTGRILFVSGYAEAYLEAAATMARARGIQEVSVLTKPVAINDLREALRA